MSASRKGGFCFFKVTLRQSGAVSAKKKYTICARGKSVVHRGNQARAQVAIRLGNEIRPVQREGSPTMRASQLLRRMARSELLFANLLEFGRADARPERGKFL